MSKPLSSDERALLRAAVTALITLARESPDRRLPRETVERILPLALRAIDELGRKDKAIRAALDDLKYHSCFYLSEQSAYGVLEAAIEGEGE